MLATTLGSGFVTQCYGPRVERFPDSEIDRLVAFLLDRVAEDEEWARSASPAPWRVAVSGFQVMDSRGVEAATAFALTGRQQHASAEHVARHDPRRVLAECTATRSIIARCLQELQAAEVGDSERTARAEWDVMCALALPHSGHRQYRANWRLLSCVT